MDSDRRKLNGFRLRTIILVLIGAHFWSWMGAIGAFLFCAYFLQPKYSSN